VSTYARVLVQQHTLDALGRWAAIATGITVMHGEQTGSGSSPTGPAPPRPAPPYVLLEFVGKPATASPKFERELDAPTSATVTLDAAHGEFVAFIVNLVRPFDIGEVAGPGSDIDELPVQRGVAETLPELAARIETMMSAQLAGRVDIAIVGDDLVFTPVRHGDLWRAENIENTTIVLGDGEPARIVDRLWRCTVRVWVYGAKTTSGAAADAGDGNTTTELTAALLEALDTDWCRALFDTFGIRRTNEPEVVTPSGRKNHALREDRAYFDLTLGVPSRYSLAPKPTAQVQFGLQVGQTPAPEGNPEPVEQEIVIDA